MILIHTSTKEATKKVACQINDQYNVTCKKIDIYTKICPKYFWTVSRSAVSNARNTLSNLIKVTKSSFPRKKSKILRFRIFKNIFL